MFWKIIAIVEFIIIVGVGGWLLTYTIAGRYM